MPQTVEVRFKGTRRDFFLWPDDREPLRLKEAVIVELERGQDFGRIQSVGQTAELKCSGGCTSCAIGTGIEESRNGGRAVEASEAESAVALEDAPEAAPAEFAELAPEVAEEPAPPAPEPSPALKDLRAVLRRASPDEIRVANDLRRNEDLVRRQVVDKVRHHKLDMKVSDAEWQWDKAKLSIYFTAEKRVDFRALVRDLASLFRTRIELRQIGVRDEAARLTGVGRCGREYCCSTWLKDLSPVSLALAKDQHLSLNPAQISGGCGRLLCCLKYEHEFYVAARRRFPREGKLLDTALGKEKVIAVDIFRERVFLRSEEHGPRIIPLVQLKDEQEARAADPSAPFAVAAPAARPPAREQPPRRENDRRGSPPEKRGRPEQAPESRRPAGAPDSRRPAREERRPAPPAAPAPPAPPVAGASATPEPASAEGSGDAKKRRRRRGRRGRGRGGKGPGGGAPPSSPQDDA
ncbi:MAG: regulatory iron-sulfur-containing complex subunit RicT [Gemmatimonadales bacterium]